MSENSNVWGGKTPKNPPVGNPPPGSTESGKKDRKKRKHRSNASSSGFTPEDKKLQQGKPVEIPGLQSPFKAPMAAAVAVGEKNQPEVSTEGKEVSETSNLAGSNRQTSMNVDEASEKVPPMEGSLTPNLELLEQDMDTTGSPKSVSSILKDTNLLDTDEEGDAELGDFSEELEKSIAETELGINPEKEGESSGEPGAKAKKTTYASKAAAAPAAKALKGYEILYIHQGKDERGPIPKETFHKLWDRFQTLVVDQVLQGQDVPDEINWRSWSQGRGLVSVKDKATSDYVCQVIGQIKIKKNTFRAWHRGEFSEGKLVTGFLEGTWAKHLTPDKIMQALIRQNKLKGRFTGTLSKVEDHGRLLKFFADPELWADLLARRQSQGSTKVRLKVGVSPTDFVLSKAKREDASEPKDESEASKPDGSNHSEPKTTDESEAPSSTKA